MANDKADRRELRKKELQKLTMKELGDVKPYKKNVVTAAKTEPDKPKKVSKAEMIETILIHEGLGAEHIRKRK